MSAETLEQIQRLHRDRPVEPFQDRPRRPNGYRDFPEYIQWRRDVRDWAQKIFQWHIDGLHLSRDEDSVAVTMHGVPAPGLRLERRPDGVIVRADEDGWAPRWPGPSPKRPDGVIVRADEDGAERAPEWFDLLELPPSRQRIDAWLKHSRKRYNYKVRWNILARLDRFVGADGMPLCTDPAWFNHALRIEAKWAEELRRLADYRAVSRLRRLTGPVEFTIIAEHNMAVLRGDLLQKLSRSNPGAVGWWLANARREHLPPLYDWQFGDLPPPSELPAHPGEVIARVQEEFRQAGGRHWKSLIRQPSRDVYALLTKFPAEAVAEVVDALAQAPPDPARPGRRSQPPGWVKKRLANICQRIRICRDEGAADAVQALESVVRLAIREFAGYAGEPLPFGGVEDYAVAEPAAARRRGSWDALWRAADEWHDEREAEFDRRAWEALGCAPGGGARRIDPAPTGAADAPEWSGALTEWADADFRARLLTSAGALRAESDLMRHCVGRAVAATTSCAGMGAPASFTWSRRTWTPAMHPRSASRPPPWR